MIDEAIRIFYEERAVIGEAPFAFVLAFAVGTIFGFCCGKRHGRVTSPAPYSGNSISIRRNSTGPINQSYTHVAPKKWRPTTFEMDSAARQLDGCSAVHARIIGSQEDWAIGEDAISQLRQRGIAVRDPDLVGVMSPPPGMPFYVTRTGQNGSIVIAPMVQQE